MPQLFKALDVTVYYFDGITTSQLYFLTTTKIKKMRTLKSFTLTLIVSLLVVACVQQQAHNEASKLPGEKISHQTPSINTPDEALAELTNGNQRFVKGSLINTDYKEQVEHTKSDQHPHSFILTCIDSRIPPEIIFDQGIGNIFVARVAGNIEDPNILGSMEYATKVKGTKLIVVMGHNKCGAVKGAVDNVELGNLTQLVNQIKPAITGDRSNPDLLLDKTAKKNVQITIAGILNNSPVISELVKEKKVKIIGAYYDLTSGQVSFME